MDGQASVTMVSVSFYFRLANQNNRLTFPFAEVVWENVRVLKNSGETVSVDGTHLGHNVSIVI